MRINKATGKIRNQDTIIGQTVNRPIFTATFITIPLIHHRMELATSQRIECEAFQSRGNPIVLPLSVAGEVTRNGAGVTYPKKDGSKVSPDPQIQPHSAKDFSASHPSLPRSLQVQRSMRRSAKMRVPMGRGCADTGEETSPKDVLGATVGRESTEYKS